MTCTKRTYALKASAKQSIRAAKAAGSKSTLTPYPCLECGNWHLTSYSANDKKRIKESMSKELSQ